MPLSAARGNKFERRGASSVRNLTQNELVAPSIQRASSGMAQHTDRNEALQLQLISGKGASA